jgi:hypothetical protein
MWVIPTKQHINLHLQFYVLNIYLLASRQENKEFSAEQYQAFPEFQL